MVEYFCVMSKAPDLMHKIKKFLIVLKVYLCGTVCAEHA